MEQSDRDPGIKYPPKMPRKTAGFVVMLCSVPLGFWLGLFMDELASHAGGVFDCSDVTKFNCGALFCAVLWTWGLRLGTAWTKGHVLWLGLNLLVSGVVGAMVGLFLCIYGDYTDNEECVFAGVLTSLCVWMISSLLLFKSSRSQRLRDMALNGCGTDLSAVILCGKCNADMTGLKKLVCPECSRSYRLDELMEVNHARKIAQLPEGQSNEG